MLSIMPATILDTVAKAHRKQWELEVYRVMKTNSDPNRVSMLQGDIGMEDIRFTPRMAFESYAIFLNVSWRSTAHPF